LLPELRLGFIPGFAAPPPPNAISGNAFIRDLLFTGRTVNQHARKGRRLVAQLTGEAKPFKSPARLLRKSPSTTP